MGGGARSFAAAGAAGHSWSGHGGSGGWHHGGGGWRGFGAGLAAGAVIGGAYGYGYGYGGPYYGDDYAYDGDGGYYGDAYAAAPEYADGDAQSCAMRYRSYDPSTGTYLGYDGMRHPCS